MNTPDFPHGMDPQNPERDDDSTIRMGTSSSEENLSPDEQALRRLMKAAVQGIEPTPDTLHHLRRAVPARRAHRRQLMAGAVAAGLLAIAAVPAALHAANTSGSADSDTANASSSHSNGGGGGAKGDNGKADSGRPAGSVSDGGKQSGGRKTSTASPSATVTKGGAGGPSPTSTIGAAAHACTSGDFGKPLSYAGSAASDGTVYGWFKLSNISSTACTIAGAGFVTAVAQGSADPTHISVVDHTAGDPATGLPNGSVKSLVLASGQAYEVQFAWIPASGGGTTGCQPTTTPTPTDTPTDGTSTTSGSTAGSTATATTAPASIVLTDTSAPATAASSVTLADACAGTVYKTGVLNAT
jgi:hypothetical protein